MSGEHEFERELTQALSVAPSSDFESRVMRRIQNDRHERTSSHYGWWLAAAAALVLLANAWFLLRPVREDAQSAPQPIVAQTSPPEVRPGAAPERSGSAGERPRALHATTPLAPAAHRRPEIRRAKTTAAAPEPEVIVSSDQREAVRQLVRDVRAGRLLLPESQLEQIRANQEGPIPPLVIESITVAPLDSSGSTPDGMKSVH